MIKIPYSIESSKYRDSILAILDAALDAVDPKKIIPRYLEYDSNRLTAGNTEYDLESVNRIVVLGAGKASQSMAAGLNEILGDRVNEGIVIVKQDEADDSIETGRIVVVEGSHPIPDERSVAGAKRVFQTAKDLTESDLAIVLISGGASSLLTLPAKGLSLLDLQATTELLLGSGANINELNIVRRHLSGIKGGRLAQAIYPARTLGLILSDVVGDDLSAIGSGPTSKDPYDAKDARDVLQKYDLLDSVPEAVTKHLKSNNSGPSDFVFTKVQNAIIGSNRHAAEAARETAKVKGFNATLVTTELKGEAREIGEMAAEMAGELKYLRDTHSKPACLVLGGETTVTIRGKGKGGRNQELALAAAAKICDVDNISVVAFATDGTDGPTTSAGAVATGNTCRRAQELNLDPSHYLDNNDSYPFFEALNDHIITGPTRTNVADLLLIFAF